VLYRLASLLGLRPCDITLNADEIAQWAAYLNAESND
jgi:hypothetical protein